MINNNTSEWTEEELAGLPQTPQVFEAPKLKIAEHDWLQEGYYIRDNCAVPKISCIPGGLPIPSGKVLVKNTGGYELIDELR